MRWSKAASLGGLIAVAASVAAILIALQPSGRSEPAFAGTGTSIDLVAIDMDPEDGDTDASTFSPVNTAPSPGTDHDGGVVGTIQSCANINEDGDTTGDPDEDAVDTVFIDVVAKGVGADDDDSSTGLVTLGLEVNYDSTKVQVVEAVTSGKDHDFMLAQGPGGKGSFFAFDDSKPDTDGQYKDSVSDLGSGLEEDDGILIRIGVEAKDGASASTTSLTITFVSNEIELETGVPTITEVRSAVIAINTPGACIDSDGDTVIDSLDDDDDNDTVLDGADNCPLVANPGQTDTDSDGDGDACDDDDDNDTILDGADNCPLVANPGQTDTDSDGAGDACDNDDDNDTILDGADNCPLVANASQTDTDSDGAGDACDSDDDNDTILDGADNCPLVANVGQTDTDSDGAGDACDSDDDNDTVLDGADNCPLVANADQTDTDSDGAGDACDTDDDNDTVLDVDDNCPLVANSDQADSNSNGFGDVCEPDTDGDTVFDVIDNCPNDFNPDQADVDADGIGDACDDFDSDGVVDAIDNCLVVPNPDQTNTDGDDRGDACDSDDDDDTVFDIQDNCRIVINPDQTNSDTDSLGDDCDNCPNDDNEAQENSDADSWGDTCDNCTTTDNEAQTNSDTDPLGDACDNCPTTDNADQANFDGDALGDACDPDDDNDGILDALDPDDDNDGTEDGVEIACGANPVDDASVPERLGNSVDDDDDGQTDEVQAPVSGQDCDGDGFRDDIEAALVWPSDDGDGATTGAETGADCGDIQDNDGDTIVNDGCASGVPTGGTGHQERCSDTSTKHDEANDQWSADFDDSGRLNINDVTTFRFPVNHFLELVDDPVPNAHARWNLNGDNKVNINDVSKVGQTFLKPPMFNGEAAWGNTTFGVFGTCPVD